MSEDRKSPGVCFWFAVSLVALILYVLGFGPAVRVVNEQWLPPLMTRSLYWTYAPIIYLGETCAPEPVQRALNWYCELWQ